MTGGARIVSYNLQIDLTGGGSGPWLDAKDSLDLTAELSPLIAGHYYFFRYRARNAHGWGDFSPISFVLLANKPDRLLPVQTINNGAMVDIKWAATPNDRNSLVSEYRVTVQRSDGAMIEHPQCKMSPQIF